MPLEEAVTAALEILSTHARAAMRPEQALMTYGSLSGQLRARGVHVAAEGSEMSLLLAEVSRSEHRAGRGMLSALVVKADTRQPGAGFFTLAKAAPFNLRGRDLQLDIWWPQVLRVHDEQRVLAAPAQRSESRAINRDNFGAWLVTCNPEAYLIARDIADGARGFDDWAVQQSYRTDMFEYGQLIFLWVTGSSRRHELVPGIWGVGFVTGKARPGDVDPDDTLWRDQALRERSKLFVPMDVRLLGDPVPRSRLEEDSRLRDLEVLRMPGGSNPFAITVDQLAALSDYVELPRLESKISFDGAGFATSAADRKAVEDAAMNLVSNWYRKQHWNVENVARKCLGWDLTCNSRMDSVELHVEVKGVSGVAPSILLTKNEYAKAAADPAWRLAIVTMARCEAPHLRIFTGQAATAAAAPLMYQVDLTGSQGENIELA